LLHTLFAIVNDAYHEMSGEFIVEG
jgi:hypothetical protein